MPHESSAFQLSSPSEPASGPAERWATLATAGAVIAYGVSRRSMSGAVLAAAATPFAYRGLVGEWPHFTNGDLARNGEASHAPGGERGTRVRESIRLEKPVSDVFRFFRRLENLPRVVPSLERVTELADRRSHWVAKGPGGQQVEWDVEIINEVDDHLIAWRSLPGSAVTTAGSITVSTVRSGRSTQVLLQLHYEPPAGGAVPPLAGSAGRDLVQTIREDLRRVKQFLEAGETARIARDQTWSPNP